MDPDWSLLLPEILQMISEKLISISDFVRFRAVCNTWRSASSPRPHHLPPQHPWLILPRGHDGEKNLCPMLSVYNLSQSRTHILDLPEIEGKQICSSSNGWLILKDRDVWLFNPITRDQISLPSLYAEPSLFFNYSEDNRRHCFVDLARIFTINNVILSSKPGIDPDCLVMALFDAYWELAFCRIGDKCWTVISEYEEHNTSQENVAKIGYHNGLFYAINNNGHVRIFDTRSLTYKVIIPEQALKSIRPVNGGYDEQGLMILYYSYSSTSLNCCPIEIHSFMTWSDKQQSWLDMEEKQVNSNIFFLGSGFDRNCISHPVANMNLEEWEGNCMCYISHQYPTRSINIKLLSLNNGRERTLAVINSDKYKYIFRESFYWLTPTLC